MINNINIYNFKILQNIKEKANIFIKNIKILVKNVNQTKKWHFLKTWQTWQKRGMGSKTWLLPRKRGFVATLARATNYNFFFGCHIQIQLKVGLKKLIFILSISKMTRCR